MVTGTTDLLSQHRSLNRSTTSPQHAQQVICTRYGARLLAWLESTIKTSWMDGNDPAWQSQPVRIVACLLVLAFLFANGAMAQRVNCCDSFDYCEQKVSMSECEAWTMSDAHYRELPETARGPTPAEAAEVEGRCGGSEDPPSLVRVLACESSLDIDFCWIERLAGCAQIWVPDFVEWGPSAGALPLAGMFMWVVVDEFATVLAQEKAANPCR